MGGEAAPVVVEGVEFFSRRMETRFPFRYGIAELTALPHVFLRVTMRVGGERVAGLSSEGLPPKWFTKRPEQPWGEEVGEMCGVIERAAATAAEQGEAASVFAWWRELYGAQYDWAAAEGVPPLLAGLGVSLMERAVLDGVCRATGVSFGEAVRRGCLGIDLGAVHGELAGREAGEFFGERAPTVAVRHTVGLGDPLERGDIPEDERLADGLPQALEDCIGRYGLTYFKVKISGDVEADRERLRRLAGVLERGCGEGGYRFTLDGNEQFRDLGVFRAAWEGLREDGVLRDFLSAPELLFVEQPLHRDVALADEVREGLASWVEGPRVIIDESDAELGSARRALELGYAGTSHKNCKGVIKGIANACLLEHRRRAGEGGRGLILSGEDLGNVGPVTLLQDLAVMHLLGIRHVERNGHHYFRGLSMYPEALQARVLERHGDLYGREEAGDLCSLAVCGGELGLGSVVAAPFGTAIEPAGEEMEWLGERDEGLERARGWFGV